MVLVAILLLSPLSGRAAVTVTDENGVVYDLVDPNNQSDNRVRVSAENASIFLNRGVAVIIPKTLTDHSTTAADTEKVFEVVGIIANAFRNTAITSLTIEAEVPEIPGYMCSGCTALTSVSCPSTVTKIGGNAFTDCGALTAVSTLESVTEIQSNAFRNCVSLASVSFSGNLLTIGSGAFSGCTSIATADIPASVTYLGSSAFQGCTALETVTFHEGSLERIQQSCFEGCTSLKAPVFPPSLIQIDNMAFKNCTSLGELTLPEAGKIYSNAFEGAYITKINWPSRPFTYFAGTVFKSVTGLTRVDIPDVFPNHMIPNYTFSACAELVTANILEGTTTLGGYTFQDCGALATISLPESLDEIMGYAFQRCTNLTGVDLPSSMTLIRQDAFTGCSSLGDITIPADVKLESGAFRGSTLTSVTWPEKPVGTIENQPFGTQNQVKSMYFPSWMTRIPDNICGSWRGLESVTIHDGVTSVGMNAFSNCTALTSIDLGNTLEVIEEQGLINCGMSEIRLPGSLREIRGNAFMACNSLQSVEFPEGLEVLATNAFRQCQALATAKFTGGPVEIGDRTFYECPVLESVYLPSKLTNIGKEAFYNCSKLKNLCEPSGTDFPSDLKVIGEYAFRACTSLEKITLPPDAHIGSGAFWNANLSEIVFPETACTFGDNVFFYNTKITEITLPAWMTEIPAGLCSSWTKLEKVTLQGNVTAIGDRAFLNNYRLTGFPWPETLVRIGNSAFSGCNRGAPEYFGPVTLYDGVVIGDNAFQNASVTEIIFMGCAEIGNNSFMSNQMIGKIAFPDCMTDIPDGFCNGWKNLTDVVLPSGLKSIGKAAFSECIRLKSIRCLEDDEETVFHLPSTIETVREEAFYGCRALTEVNLPEKEVTYGDSTYRGIFEGCDGLTKVTIPRAMTKVPEKGFFNCRNLTGIVYTERDGAPLEFGRWAFCGCVGLPEILFPETEIVLNEQSFGTCTAATRIVWPENHALKLGKQCFVNCYGLTEVSIPDYITEIPYGAFQSCTKLATLQLNGLETLIDEAAFRSCAITDLSWAKEGRTPVIGELGRLAFQSNKFTELTIPASIKTIKESCFSNCQNLVTLRFEEGVTTLDGESVFGYCTSLKEAYLPSTLQAVSPKCFQGDTALEKVMLAEGLKNIGYMSFYRCSSLKEIEIPSTVTLVGQDSFKSCESLEKVISHAVDVTIGDGAFQDLTNLKTFSSSAHMSWISKNCFSGCTALSDFTISAENDWVDNIGQLAFDGCTSLTSFPWLRGNVRIDSNAFQGCTSLKEMVLPETEAYHTYRFNRTTDMQTFNGDSSLQTLTFPCGTTPYFVLSAADIAGAPLRAVSFSYADDIVPLGNAGSTIKQYAGAGSYNVEANPENSILYVKRGQRWKYIEAGYGELFDIREMKEPQINIEGDIFSHYVDDVTDEHYNRNRYQVILRWKLPLSDLNADGETVAHLYRDGVKVADIVFSKPSEPRMISKDDDAAAPTVPVKEVAYTVNGKVTSFQGNFDFLAETEANGTPVYEMRYGLQNKSLYYDASSHKMLNAMDSKSFEPWFTFVDEFYSKPLDEAEARESFVYTAEIEPYDYKRYVNNADLAEGDDGKLYHEEDVHFAGGVTDGVEIHTAMASLQLDFRHLYTEEQIREDIDQKLPATTMENLKSKATLAYTLDEDLVHQKGRYVKDGRTITDNIITAVDLREKQPDGSFRSVLKNTNGHAVNRMSSGTINLNTELPSDYVLEPGKTYQLVTYSLFRGEFGSKTITIPDLPGLTCTIGLQVTPHALADPNGHTWIPFNTFLTVTPDATPTGYTSTMPENDSDCYFGIWRTIDNDFSAPSPKPGMQRDIWRPTYEWKTVVHHADGHVDGNSGSDCTQCRTTWKVEKDNTSLMLTDVFDHGAHPFKAIYDTRLYVKVPETMLHVPDRWMAVDLPADAYKETFTDVEEIEADGIDSDAIYYDMQGRIVAHPESGDILIRVRGTEISKIRIR